jgi:glycosyltransferase involved in cell wall biosynthesis
MVEATALMQERFPEVELHIIGQFSPQTFEAVIRRRVQELGISDRVHIHGRLPLDDALLRVAKCDIGLALLHPDPNYLESLPTKMFEYMSLRLPVVVSSFAMWQEIVEDAHCGVAVEPQSVPRIVQAIEWLHADPNRLRELGESGRAAVLERYSWDMEEKKLLSLYEQLGNRAADSTQRAASKAHRSKRQAEAASSEAAVSMSAGVEDAPVLSSESGRSSDGSP